MLTLIVPAAVIAQVAPAPAPAPGGALDISVVQGVVDLQRGTDGTEVAAVAHAPLLAGDILSTGQDSYAEIHMGRGVRLRLDGNSQIRVANIDASGSEVQLGQGTVELRLFRAGSAQVDTPQIGMLANSPGSYAIAMNPDGTSTVTAFAGSATVLEQSGAQQTLVQGQSLQASGTADAPSLEPTAAIALSPQFVAFNGQLDQAAARQFANASAAAPIDGAEDLVGYGRWIDTPYGWAWVPNEPPSWTPYSAGQWAWEPYYGYVWVGYEPWGWAPYHYGRWFFRPGIGWAWAPGPPAPWAPGFVVFVRTGPTIAWLPLAPRDPFVPWWGVHASFGFGTNIAVYHNVYVAHAFVATPLAAFSAGNFTGVRAVAYANLGHPVFVDNITRAIPPTRANLAFGARTVVHPIVHPAVFASRSFAGHPVTAQRSFARPYPQFAHPNSRPHPNNRERPREHPQEHSGSHHE